MTRTIEMKKLQRLLSCVFSVSLVTWGIPMLGLSFSRRRSKEEFMILLPMYNKCCIILAVTISTILCVMVTCWDIKSRAAANNQPRDGNKIDIESTYPLLPKLQHESRLLNNLVTESLVSVPVVSIKHQICAAWVVFIILFCTLAAWYIDPKSYRPVIGYKTYQHFRQNCERDRIFCGDNSSVKTNYCHGGLGSHLVTLFGPALHDRAYSNKDCTPARIMLGDRDLVGSRDWSYDRDITNLPLKGLNATLDAIEQPVGFQSCRSRTVYFCLVFFERLWTVSHSEHFHLSETEELRLIYYFMSDALRFFDDRASSIGFLSMSYPKNVILQRFRLSIQVAALIQTDSGHPLTVQATKHLSDFWRSNSPNDSQSELHVSSDNFVLYFLPMVETVINMLDENHEQPFDRERIKTRQGPKRSFGLYLQQCLQDGSFTDKCLWRNENTGWLLTDTCATAMPQAVQSFATLLLAFRDFIWFTVFLPVFMSCVSLFWGIDSLALKKKILAKLEEEQERETLAEKGLWRLIEYLKGESVQQFYESNRRRRLMIWGGLTYQLISAVAVPVAKSFLLVHCAIVSIFSLLLNYHIISKTALDSGMKEK